MPRHAAHVQNWCWVDLSGSLSADPDFLRGSRGPAAQATNAGSWGWSRRQVLLVGRLIVLMASCKPSACKMCGLRRCGWVCWCSNGAVCSLNSPLHVGIRGARVRGRRKSLLHPLRADARVERETTHGRDTVSTCLVRASPKFSCATSS